MSPNKEIVVFIWFGECPDYGGKTEGTEDINEEFAISDLRGKFR